MTSPDRVCGTDLAFAVVDPKLTAAIVQQDLPGSIDRLRLCVGMGARPTRAGLHNVPAASFARYDMPLIWIVDLGHDGSRFLP